jgi:hypothetical protein
MHKRSETGRIKGTHAQVAVMGYSNVKERMSVLNPSTFSAILTGGAFRFNERKFKDAERFVVVLQIYCWDTDRV